MIESEIQKALTAEARLLAVKYGCSEGLDDIPFLLQAPRDDANGDLAANIAMTLAPKLRRPPHLIARELAGALSDKLASRPFAGDIEKIEAAKGFVNFVYSLDYWRGVVRTVLEQGGKWGHDALIRYGHASDPGGVEDGLADDEKLRAAGHSEKVAHLAGAPVNVEMVSANPTGPLHIAHARGAVVGDVIANILEFLNIETVREYYVNDGGAQIKALGRSMRLRLKERAGEDLDEEKLEYVGAYLREHAAELVRRNPDAPVLDDDELAKETVALCLAEIKRDLAGLGVKIDRFSHERDLLESGVVESLMEELKSRDLVYLGRLPPPKSKKEAAKVEPGREQPLMRVSKFGDDIDRPLTRPDGSPTYFAVDVAYHLDKAERLKAAGGSVLIDVLGADHDGYVPRIAAALKAVGRGEPKAVVYQIVKVIVDGKPIKLSKRAGNIVTLNEMLKLVGRDILRFSLLTRSSDTPLDIDCDRLGANSRDNVVFYVHYAHARLASVLRKAREAGLDFNDGFDPSSLSLPKEIALIRQISLWPRALEQAAYSLEPHRLTKYLYRLAQQVHELWAEARNDPDKRILVEDRPESTKARLALCEAARLTIKTGLDIFGIAARDRL